MNQDPTTETIEVGIKYIRSFIENGLGFLGTIQVSCDSKIGKVGALVGLIHQCSNCGADVFEDADYCPYCGHEQESE